MVDCLEKFESSKKMAKLCRAGAIVPVGFGILLIAVRMVTSLFGGFFYVYSSSSLLWWVGGGASAHRFPCHGIPTPFNLPPVLGISDGRNLTTRSSL